MLGTCIYCGQKMMTELEDEQQANDFATDNCKCKEGQNHRSKVDAIEKSIRDLEFCLEDASDRVIDAFSVIIKAMYNDEIMKITIKKDDRTRIELTRKVSSVKIEKKHTTKTTFENDEA